MRKPRNSNFFGCRGTLDGSKVALKDMHGQYLVATSNNEAMVIGRTSTDSGATFTVEDLGGNDETRTIALKSIHGKLLVAYRSSVSVDATSLRDEAKFEVKHNSKQQYWFKTANNKYLYHKNRNDGSFKQVSRPSKYAKFYATCLPQSEGPYESNLSGQSGSSYQSEGIEMRGSNGAPGIIYRLCILNLKLYKNIKIDLTLNINLYQYENHYFSFR